MMERGMRWRRMRVERGEQNGMVEGVEGKWDDGEGG